jgi:hypothetical protein
MREITVRNYLVEQVELRNGLCELHTAPGQRGVPDCLVTWPFGDMELVETKTKNGRLSGAQKRDHARRKKLNVRVYVLWSKEQVDRYVWPYDSELRK